MREPFQVIQVESRAFASKMDPVNVIRAPSLKRGKPDERLTDRVSVKSVMIMMISFLISWT